MGRKPSYTAQQFIKAIPGSGGIITTIAKRLHCDWNTAKRWIYMHPTIKAVYNAECERVLDTAESVVIQALENKMQTEEKGLTGTPEPALRFQMVRYYLSTKGRGRGYATNLEMTSHGTLASTVREMPATPVTPEELDQFRRAMAQGYRALGIDAAKAEIGEEEVDGGQVLPAESGAAAPESDGVGHRAQAKHTQRK